MTRVNQEIPLWKVSSFLRGIAIMAMVLNHSAFFGVMQYRINHMQVTQIYHAPFGIPWEIIMPGWIILQELTRFCVPLFLVLIGQYVANFGGTWKIIWKQLTKFIYAYIFWSFIGWAYSLFLDPPVWNPFMFLLKVLKGCGQPGYYFFPLIIQYYLLSQWIVPKVKQNPKFALILSALIQLSWLGVDYFALAVRGGIIAFPFFPQVLPDYLFPRFLFFYILGIWIGAFPDRFKDMINKKGFLLFFLLIMSMVLLISEHGVIYHFIRKPGAKIQLWKVFTAMTDWKLTTSIWSLFVILFLFRLGQFNFLSWKWSQNLSASTFAIYILNGPILQPITKILNSLTIASQYQWIVFLLFSGLSILLPLLLIYLSKKWIPWVRFVLGYS